MHMVCLKMNFMVYEESASASWPHSQPRVQSEPKPDTQQQPKSQPQSEPQAESEPGSTSELKAESQAPRLSSLATAPAIALASRPASTSTPAPVRVTAPESQQGRDYVDLKERKSSKAIWLPPQIGIVRTINVCRPNSTHASQTCSFLETGGFQTKRGIRGTFQCRSWVKVCAVPNEEMLVMAAGNPFCFRS